jgi:hypothetical protein
MTHGYETLYYLAMDFNGVPICHNDTAYVLSPRLDGLQAVELDTLSEYNNANTIRIVLII